MMIDEVHHAKRQSKKQNDRTRRKGDATRRLKDTSGVRDLVAEVIVRRGAMSVEAMANYLYDKELDKVAIRRFALNGIREGVRDAYNEMDVETGLPKYGQTVSKEEGPDGESAHQYGLWGTLAFEDHCLNWATRKRLAYQNERTAQKIADYIREQWHREPEPPDDFDARGWYEQGESPD
jgi:hypothetical protein